MHLPYFLNENDLKVYFQKHTIDNVITDYETLKEIAMKKMMNDLQGLLKLY